MFYHIEKLIRHPWTSGNNLVRVFSAEVKDSSLTSCWVIRRVGTHAALPLGQSPWGRHCYCGLQWGNRGIEWLLDLPEKIAELRVWTWRSCSWVCDLGPSIPCLSRHLRILQKEPSVYPTRAKKKPQINKHINRINTNKTKLNSLFISLPGEGTHPIEKNLPKRWLREGQSF